MSKFIDLTGQRYGRLTVIKRAGTYTPADGFGKAATAAPRSWFSHAISVAEIHSHAAATALNAQSSAGQNTELRKETYKKLERSYLPSNVKYHAFP